MFADEQKLCHQKHNVILNDVKKNEVVLVLTGLVLLHCEFITVSWVASSYTERHGLMCGFDVLKSVCHHDIEFFYIAEQRSS